MKLGCCVGVPTDDESKKRALSVTKTGFDYVELGLSKLVDMDEAVLLDAIGFMQANAIPCHAVNLFIPGDLRVVGNDVDFDKIRRYFEKAFPIVHRLGASVIVFGSGGARLVPQGYSIDTANTQLISFLRLANGYCNDYDVTIAIEPLCSRECNIVTSVKEGFWLSKYTDRDRIKLLADYYHMLSDREPIDNVTDAKSCLIHTHTATKKGRKYPLSADHDEQAVFFAALKEIGYQGGVSIEGGTDNFYSDIKEAFALLNALRQ